MRWLLWHLIHVKPTRAQRARGTLYNQQEPKKNSHTRKTASLLCAAERGMTRLEQFIPTEGHNTSFMRKDLDTQRLVSSTMVRGIAVPCKAVDKSRLDNVNTNISLN